VGAPGAAVQEHHRGRPRCRVVSKIPHHSIPGLKIMKGCLALGAGGNHPWMVPTLPALTPGGADGGARAGATSRGAGPDPGSGVILLDTTILIYALGDDQYRHPSRHLLQLIRDGEVRASTTIEVIQEFCQVRSRRRPRREAAARALEYAKGLAPLILVEEPELRLGLELFAASSALSPFDAVLAATALHRG
jgi:predicted nucleic acid-binding protein